MVWDHQAAGSNPVTRTKKPLRSAISEVFCKCARQWEALAKGKGVRREAESEGSRIAEYMAQQYEEGRLGEHLAIPEMDDAFSKKKKK